MTSKVTIIVDESTYVLTDEVTIKKVLDAITNDILVPTITKIEEPPFKEPPALFQFQKFVTEFQPCVIEASNTSVTTMLLRDEMVSWHPWGPYKGHAVDLGYNSVGELIGIQIWDDVARLKPKEQTR